MNEENWKKNDGWITTHTGKKFYPLNPKVEDIDIKDIAHALSLICRFSGHCPEHYCPTPDQRILTGDLRWMPAGELKKGDLLLGFDEFATEIGMAGNKQRKFRPSIVTYIKPTQKSVFELFMSDGSSVKCSKEHPWLTATKQSGNQKWLTTEQIVEDLNLERKRYLHRYFTPWKEPTTYDEGWLSGIIDGEGHFSFKNKRGTMMGVAQNPGNILDKIRFLFDKYNVKYSEMKQGNKKYRTKQLQIRGGWEGILQLLGSIRPIRLLQKFKKALISNDFSKTLINRNNLVEIIGYKYLGYHKVIGIETSTHTYICEGFGAHNSVAQHCCIVSTLVSPENSLWALLHDASEAFIADVARPLKRTPEFEPYRRVEKKVMDIIVTKFGLSCEEPKEIRLMDTLLLRCEAKNFGLLNSEWENYDMPDLGIVIKPMSPKKAESYFLERFEELKK